MKTFRSLFLMTMLTALFFVQIAAAHHNKGGHLWPSESLTRDAILSDAQLLGCDFSGTNIFWASEPFPESDPVPDAVFTSDVRSLPAFMSGIVVGARPLPEPEVLIKATCGAGQLSGVISQAKAVAEAGQSVRVVLPPCIYREQLSISDVHSGSIEFVAQVPGTAVISGADVFAGWSQSGEIWSHAWTLDFGLHWPSNWPSRLPQDELLKRVETFFVNGRRLTQVSSFDELIEESFFIDEGRDLAFIKTQIDLNNALVEGTVRQRAIQIDRAENIAIHGIREEYAASGIQADPAVVVVNSANILLEDMVIRDNSGIGLAVWTTEFITTRRVQFLDNGYTGYNAYKAKGLLSEDDTVSGSNWRGFPFGMVGYAIAGFKHLKTHGAVYRRLTAIANLTRGFWLDFDIADVVIEDSRWCGNSTEGAFLEAIQGPLLIRRLTVCDNSKPGILISTVRNITIEDSQFGNNGRAQIHFSGSATRNVTDFETGEQFVLSTDFWEVTNSNLSAFGNQTILSGPLLPPNFVASGNTCQTDNPTVMDGLICQ